MSLHNIKDRQCKYINYIKIFNYNNNLVGYFNLFFYK